MWVWSLGWEDPLENGRKTHSSILSWRIHGQRILVDYTVHRVSKSQTRMKWLKVKVAQLCLTLCNPMNCTVHGILQARILMWVASQPRDWTQVSRITGRFFTSWATGEAQGKWLNTCIHKYIYKREFGGQKS